MGELGVHPRFGLGVPAFSLIRHDAGDGFIWLVEAYSTAEAAMSAAIDLYDRTGVAWSVAPGIAYPWADEEEGD